MKIVLKSEDSYKPRFENAEEMKDSFFKDVYQEGLKHIAEITNYHSPQNNSDQSQRTISYKAVEDFNNIIAFAGDRGSGKTSAMISLIDAIVNIGDKAKLIDYLKQTVFEEKNAKILDNHSFLRLDLIDPTRFSGKETIIEVVVAKMFKAFKAKLEQDKNYNGDKIKATISGFQKVFEALRVIKLPSEKIFGEDIGYSESDLDRLSELAIGPSLAERFQKLVEQYLEFMDSAKGILIIPIDDVDLHVGNNKQVGVIEHLEDIRKYLCVKRVIVTIGVNIPQLQGNVQQEFIRSYRDLFKEEKEFKSTLEMAVHYMEKFIPSTRRLYLPTVLGELYRTINIELPEKGVTETKSIFDFFDNLTELKIGIKLLTKDLYNLHPFLPKTLRELHHFYHFLTTLEDITPFTKRDYQNAIGNKKKSDLTKQYETHKKNIDKFEAYFIDFWCSITLSQDFINFIFELTRVHIESKNKFICTKIWDLIQNHKENQYPEKIEDIEILDTKVLVDTFNKQLTEIVKRTNYSSNVSIGDTIATLKSIKDFLDNSLIDNLIFAIKTVLSIDIFRTLIISPWEKILSEMAPNFNAHELQTIITESNNEAQKLIGPSLYSKDALNFLPANESQSGSISKFDENRGNAKIIDFYKQIMVPFLNESDIPESKDAFELFSYFIHNIPGGIKYLTYRRLNKDLIQWAMHNQTASVNFNLMFFWANIMNIRQSNEKFLNPESNNKAFISAKFNEQDNSLRNQIINWISDNGHIFPYYNLEFNESTFYQIKELISKNPVNKEEADDVKFLKVYFEIFQKQFTTSISGQNYRNQIANAWKESPVFFLSPEKAPLAKDKAESTSKVNPTKPVVESKPSVEIIFYNIFRKAINPNLLLLSKISKSFSYLKKGDILKYKPFLIEVEKLQNLLEFLKTYNKLIDEFEREQNRISNSGNKAPNGNNSVISLLSNLIDKDITAKKITMDEDLALKLKEFYNSLDSSNADELD